MVSTARAELSLPEGTVTFLRSDIEGSMDLVRALGARYDGLNAEHGALVRAAVQEHGGQVVRTEGDAFFVVFTDAGAAARTAVDIQRAMGGHTWPSEHPFTVRIGIHSGTATRAGDDYGGFEVNRAARISAMGWGGQIILSDAARALVAADLPEDRSIRELGRYRLKGILEPERIFQLDAPGLATDFPGLRSAAGPSEHLPTRVTSFIGREEELEVLSGLLQDTRVLTLTGPGGTGKTTLALELARRSAVDYEDGTWFVDLQALREPDQVKAEIAHGLDMYDGSSGAAADRLLEFISDRELLLIIDNFEQVIEAADVVSEMLQASAGIRVIVTSRVALRLGSEQEYAVRPLVLTADESGGEPEAVRLFVDRVRRVQPTLTFGESEMETVRETCRLLDGLPLAIELTAARASALPLRLICDRLAKRMPLPGSGPRDLPERQRTIEDTVAWSYGLLEAPLQHLLRRLAVFVETFDLEQAEEVCGPAEELGMDVLDGLFQLAGNSLIHRVDDDIGGVRFGMLETIRAQALGWLLRSGEESALRARHAEAYARLAEKAAQHLPGPDQAHWIDRLEPDDPNLRTAANWAIETGSVELAIGCAARPWRFWLMTGRLAEGTELIRRALSLEGAEAGTPARLTALDAAGGVAYWAGDLEHAHSRYDEQLALAGELSDERGRALALLNLAFVRFLEGDVPGYQQTRDEAVRLFEQQGNQVSLQLIRWAETLSPGAWGDSAEHAAAAVALADELDELGSPWYTAMALAARSTAAFVSGDVTTAAVTIVRGLRVALSTHEFAGASFYAEPLSLILTQAGDPEAAAVTLGALERVWLRYGIRPPVSFYEASGLPDPLPLIKEALGPVRFDGAIVRGSKLSENELVDFLEASFAHLSGATDAAVLG